MNRYATIHATPDLTVSRVDHPPDRAHCDPELEVAGRWAISFVHAGGFEVEADGVRRQLGVGGVLLTRPGFAYRCRHHLECPDDVCTSVGFDPGAVADAEHAWGRAGWFARAVATPKLAYVQRRLAQAVDSGNRFEAERWGIAGLTALVADANDARARGQYAVRRSVLDAVIAASEAIEAGPTRLRSVAEIASGVGMTSTRLTHAFRRCLGISPHQYVVRRRLNVAAELLDQGRSVSESCWQSGFENLSHFCRTFKRALGIRASEWVRLPRTERRRKVQALLRGVA